MNPNLSFWQWFVSDLHWFYVFLVLWVLANFLEDVVISAMDHWQESKDKKREHERKIKELELEQQRITATDNKPKHGTTSQPESVTELNIRAPDDI